MANESLVLGLVISCISVNFHPFQSGVSDLFSKRTTFDFVKMTRGQCGQTYSASDQGKCSPLGGNVGKICQDDLWQDQDCFSYSEFFDIYFLSCT